MFSSVVDYHCNIKHSLGDRDVSVGTRKALDILQADPAATDHAATAAGCVNCHANVRRAPFGCAAVPVAAFPKAAEAWLLSRLQPPTAIGGAVCLQTIAGDNLTGEPTRDARASGVFGAFPGLTHSLPTNPFGRDEVSADELFHWLCGGRLAPWQSLSLLLWFGAVKIDDTVPQTADDARRLTRLAHADRAKRAKLSLTKSDDPTVEPARDLLKNAFVAWARNVDLVVVTG